MVAADVGFAEASWIMVVKSLVIFAVILGIVPMILLLERKLLGRFQARYGPNRVGPKGLFQPLADVVKLLSKEAYKPEAAVPVLWAIAPALVILSATATLAIIPFGDVADGNVGLYGIDVSIGILYAFAFGSISFYGLLLGGWASGSKYSFMGAMRSAAQLISYEISMGLALLGVIMMAGSLSLVDIANAQADSIWYVDPAVRRLPDLHGRRLRGDEPPALRPPRGRRRARRRLQHRVRRDALRLLLHGRVHGDGRRLRDRRGDVPRRLARPRARLARRRSGCSRRS